MTTIVRNKYKQVSNERYQIIMERNDRFRQGMDKNVPPVKVFDPLLPQRLAELELIRDVSRFLQKKKDEDIKKAANARNDEEKQEAKEVEKEDL